MHAGSRRRACCICRRNRLFRARSPNSVPPPVLIVAATHVRAPILVPRLIVAFLFVLVSPLGLGLAHVSVLILVPLPFIHMFLNGRMLLKRKSFTYPERPNCKKSIVKKEI